MRLKRAKVKLARQINIFTSSLSDKTVQITIEVSELLDIKARFITVYCFNTQEDVIMEITKVNDVASAKNPHGVDARPIYTHENAQVIILTLKPGDALRRHITPVDVFFYVLEGKGIVEIGDEKQEVAKDAIVHSPAKILHCWYNDSDTPLRIMVAKTPKPKESTILL